MVTDPATATASHDATASHHATASQPSSSRLGLTLFVIYTLLYLGFVLLNALAADRMDIVVVAGLNLAIVYGFGLILAAIAMAFVYGFARRAGIDNEKAAAAEANSNDGEPA